MKVSILLYVALALIIVLIAVATFSYFVEMDTATHEQGPLNPHNSELVKAVALGRATASREFAIGLALPAILLVFGIVGLRRKAKGGAQ